MRKILSGKPLMREIAIIAAITVFAVFVTCITVQIVAYKTKTEDMYIIDKTGVVTICSAEITKKSPNRTEYRMQDCWFE